MISQKLIMTTNSYGNSAYRVKYIEQLSKLIKVKSSVPKLFPLEEMGSLRERVKLLGQANKRVYQLAFEEKTSLEFEDFVVALAQANGEPILIWSELSNDFGPIKLNSLLDVDFSFSFDVLPEGIVAIVTEDGSDKILLDWEDDKDCGPIITVELLGERWSKVKYPATGRVK